MRIRNPIKLTSLNLRARAEPCRLLLTYSGYKFCEERIPCSSLEEVLDPDNRPTLNWGEGTVIKGSLPICRFIARELDLMGATKFEEAQVDAIVDVLEDALNTGYAATLIKDESLKQLELNKYHEETVPAMLQYLEKRITESGGEFLIGNEVTWADIHLFYFATQGHMLKLVKVPKLSRLVQKVGKIQEFEFYDSHYRPETKF